MHHNLRSAPKTTEKLVHEPASVFVKVAQTAHNVFMQKGKAIYFVFPPGQQSHRAECAHDSALT